MCPPLRIDGLRIVAPSGFSAVRNNSDEDVNQGRNNPERINFVP
jgi:hypothetical protein